MALFPLDSENEYDREKAKDMCVGVCVCVAMIGGGKGFESVKKLLKTIEIKFPYNGFKKKKID